MPAKQARQHTTGIAQLMALVDAMEMQLATSPATAANLLAALTAA